MSEKYGGIYFVTGKLGHGKTLYALRKVVQGLLAGIPVATNIELVEGWADTLAGFDWRNKFSARRRAAVAAQLEANYHLVRDVQDLRRMRIAPCGTCDRCRKGGACRREARGWCVLDETHIWLNNRTWNVDETGTSLSPAAAILQRKKLNTFFAQARKLGWVVYLISQGEGQLDKQVKDLKERHIHLKNARKLAAWWNPVRWARIDLFVAVTMWGGDRQGTRIGTEMFTLNKRIAGLYDTMATYELDDELEGDIILLTPAPLIPAGIGQRAEGSQAAADPAGDDPQADQEGVAA